MSGTEYTVDHDFFHRVHELAHIAQGLVDSGGISDQAEASRLSKSSRLVIELCRAAMGFRESPDPGSIL